MKPNTRHLINIMIYLGVFLLIQMIISTIAAFIFHGDVNSKPLPVIIISSVSSLLTIILFAWRKWFPLTKTYLQTRPWTTLLWVVVLSLGTIIPSEWMQEQLGMEELERLMTQLLSSPAGYVAVGILVPLAEEIVFRGAILRTLLRLLPGNWHWGAILISALIFGAVHGNMVQFVHATLLGLLLGWMYWRTDSIVPGVVLHWVNNSVAYVICRLMPGMTDVELIDLFKGNERSVILAVVFSLLIFLPALYQLNLRLKK